MKTFLIFFASIFFVLLHVPLAYAEPLSDIEGHPYKAAIESLYDQGIIEGYEHGTFRPDATITRAEPLFEDYIKDGTVFVARSTPGELYKIKIVSFYEYTYELVLDVVEL
jgi:hypothetical protein